MATSKDSLISFLPTTSPKPEARRLPFRPWQDCDTETSAGSNWKRRRDARRTSYGAEAARELRAHPIGNHLAQARRCADPAVAGIAYRPSGGCLRAAGDHDLLCGRAGLVLRQVRRVADELGAGIRHALPADTGGHSGRHAHRLSRSAADPSAAASATAGCDAGGVGEVCAARTHSHDLSRYSGVGPAAEDDAQVDRLAGV